MIHKGDGALKASSSRGIDEFVGVRGQFPEGVVEGQSVDCRANDQMDRGRLGSP